MGVHSHICKMLFCRVAVASIKTRAIHGAQIPPCVKIGEHQSRCKPLPVAQGISAAYILLAG